MFLHEYVHTLSVCLFTYIFTPSKESTHSKTSSCFEGETETTACLGHFLQGKGERGGFIIDFIINRIRAKLWPFLQDMRKECWSEDLLRIYSDFWY